MSQQNDLFDRKSIRSALRAWQNLTKLGNHALAQLGIVESRRQQAGYDDNNAGHGLALRAVLRDAIEGFKPKGEEPTPLNKPWGQYITLTEQYMAGRSRKSVEETRLIAQATYTNWQRSAIDSLAEKLWEWEQKYSPPKEEVVPEPPQEEEAGDRRGPCPPPDPFLAPPLPPYPIIGRDQILNNLKRQLFAGNNLALFALNGLPGVGKTALAIALAHDAEVWAHFKDGVLWAGLGRQPDLSAHLRTWGMALGIPPSEMGKFATIEQQARAIHTVIGTRRMLLVIDDAWDINQALDFKLGGPNCAHILTTRNPELAWDFAQEGAKPVHELNEADSLALLGQFVPQLLINQPKQARALVNAVDGLPLALILMGRYLQKRIRFDGSNVLPHLLEQLQHVKTRLELTRPQSVLEKLPSLPRGVPISLLASIEISDHALEEPARQVLRALSVFLPKPNTFSQEAALAASAKPVEDLHKLTEAGLVESSGSERYTLHQVIADYASFKNPSPESHHRRAATYFADFAQEYSKDGYNELDLDWQNIDHAMQWAYNNQQWQALLLGVEGLTEANLGVVGFMDARGHWRKVKELLEKALEGARRLNEPEAEASILSKMGAFAFRQADFKAAEQHLKQSLSILEELPDTEEIILHQTHSYEFLARLEMGREIEAAHQWIEQGLTALAGLETEEARYQKGYFYVLLSELNGRTGRFPEATRAAEKGLVLLPPRPSSAQVLALIVLGNVFGLQGKIEKAIEYQKEGISIAQELGDSRRLADLLMNMGNNEGFRRSNLAPAIASYRKALEIYQRMGDSNRESNIHYNFGLIYIMLGEDELALSHLTTAIRLSGTHGLLWQEAFAKTNLAHLQICRNELAEAAAALTRAYEICTTLEIRTLLPVVLYWQAEIARLKGEHDKALVLISKSLQVAREARRLLSEGIGCSIKGRILDGMGRFNEAEAAHQTSLEILAEQSPYDLAQSKMAFGEHYRLHDGYVSERAKSWLTEALAMFKKLGAKRDIMISRALLDD